MKLGDGEYNLTVTGKRFFFIALIIVMFITLSNIIAAGSIIYAVVNRHEKTECVKAKGTKDDTTSVVLCIKPK